jgi:hypothetical protein
MHAELADCLPDTGVRKHREEAKEDQQYRATKLAQVLDSSGDFLASIDMALQQNQEVRLRAVGSIAENTTASQET